MGMIGEMGGLTIMEQLHMAALATYTNEQASVIEYEDAEGHKTVTGSVFYFTNTTVCLQDGRLINIKDIRRITC